MQEIINRLFIFIEKMQKSSSEFVLSTGIDIYKIKQIDLNDVIKILEYYPELSARWFLLGCGNYLNETQVNISRIEHADFNESSNINEQCMMVYELTVKLEREKQLNENLELKNQQLLDALTRLANKK